MINILNYINNKKQISFIYEATESNSVFLSNIDDAFQLLKIDINNEFARKKLLNNLKKFTNINDITVTYEKKLYNAGVIPTYHSIFIRYFLKKLEKKNYKTKNYITAEEQNKYIKSIDIVYGQKLLKDLKPRQNTSVLLHELGHVYSSTMILPIILTKLTNSIYIAYLIAKFATLFLSPPGFILFLTLLASKTATFIEHQREYNADKYAVKYGYGIEMNEVLIKLHKKQSKNINNNFYHKLIKFITSLILPTTHPESKERACKLLKVMLNEYKIKYDFLKDVLNKRFSNLNC